MFFEPEAPTASVGLRVFRQWCQTGGQCPVTAIPITIETEKNWFCITYPLCFCTTNNKHQSQRFLLFHLQNAVLYNRTIICQRKKRGDYSVKSRWLPTALYASTESLALKIIPSWQHRSKILSFMPLTTWLHPRTMGKAGFEPAREKPGQECIKCGCVFRATRQLGASPWEPTRKLRLFC